MNKYLKEIDKMDKVIDITFRKEVLRKILNSISKEYNCDFDIKYVGRKGNKISLSCKCSNHEIESYIIEEIKEMFE